MNKILYSFIIIFTLSGCSQKMPNTMDSHKEHAHKDSNTESYYTCSMHPQIHEEHPGKCPICHMGLTKVSVESNPGAVSLQKENKLITWQCKNFPDVTSELPGPCPIDGVAMVEMNVLKNKMEKVIAKVMLRKSQLTHFHPAVVPVSSMIMEKEVRLLGSVTQVEDNIRNVSIRVGGRIEKVFNLSVGSFIKQGDPVVTIYSPKLITAGEEFILANRNYINIRSADNKDMLLQSRQRLINLGVLEQQFQSWYSQGHVPKVITIYSVVTGIVEKRHAFKGKYFKEGQDLFNLIDLSHLWVEMDVYESDSTLVGLGQKVELNFIALHGKYFVETIDFIAPTLNIQSRTIKIRTTIANTNGLLRPGMTADAKLKIKFNNEKIVVPSNAVIDTGKRKVVWVKKNSKYYQAKLVTTGVSAGGYIEICSGLKLGEQVVAEGNFMLDAQAQLFGGYEKSKSVQAHHH